VCMYVCIYVHTHVLCFVVPCSSSEYKSKIMLIKLIHYFMDINLMGEVSFI
jgi:hypothetical protein